MGASAAGGERVATHVSADGASVPETEHAHLVQQKVSSASLGGLSVHIPVSAAFVFPKKFFQPLLLPISHLGFKIVMNVSSSFASSPLSLFYPTNSSFSSSLLLYYLTSIHDIYRGDL